jgi:molybdenum cofactor cytidylyltransferase
MVKDETIDVAAILLAAGLSRRMGDVNKLLIDIEGEPLVRRAAKAYLAAGSQVHVVLGHEAKRVEAALADLPVTFIENLDYADGQPSSVRVGLESLPRAVELVLVALADQAALTTEDIAGLIGAFARSDRNYILIPFFRGERGNPVAFPARLIGEGRARGVEVASRGFIDSHPELVARYEAPNDHFVIDIDTPDDLTRFQSRAQRSGPDGK